jgi:hypothetical protein
MNYTEESVLIVMKTLMNINGTNINCEKTINRHIQSTFGFSPDVVLETCSTKLHNAKNATLKHLLWMFSYLKTYLAY